MHISRSLGLIDPLNVMQPFHLPRLSHPVDRDGLIETAHIRNRHNLV